MQNKTIIIAEAGVNHNGSIAIARQLIDVAADSGADYVKFQTFKTENLVSQQAKKAAYQIQNTGNKEEKQFDMIKKLELDYSAHIELIQYCQQKNIHFLSTAFDIESLHFLHELDLPLFKIPSGEITNLPYLKEVARCKKPIILSTGMSNLADIEAALSVLLEYGLNRKDITILHCNTEYPTPMQDVNLRAMQTIAHAFDVAVGYSDHTAGIEVAIAAVAMGANVIEKHFTLSKEMEGPDHAASLEPDELKAMVRSIRNVECCLGSPIKKPSPSERKNIPIARKSIHLAHGVEKHHVIQEADLIMKRPGDGVSPMEMYRVIGKKTIHHLPKDHKLSFSDIV